MAKPPTNEANGWRSLQTASRIIEPLELIPPELVPSEEVLSAGRNTIPSGVYDRDLSDIFPINPSVDFEGELGAYNHRLQRGNPLVETVMGLVMSYDKYSEQTQQAAFSHTEAVIRGKKAAALQRNLGICIAGAYDNVVERTNSPTVAVAAIKSHIERQDESRLADYEFEIDYRTQLLAALDRPKPRSPVTAASSRINGVPSFPAYIPDSGAPISSETLRLHKIEYTKKQIRVARQRIKRLRFEYVSAVALTRMLKAAVV